MSWFPFIAISVKQWGLTQTKSQWMTGSNCKTIGIFDSCSWQWMQGLLWHLPELFSWEISENNNCQLHTGKQLKAAGVSMLTRKGFVNKHLCTKISKSPSYILLLGSPLFVLPSTLAENVQGWQKRNQVPTEDRLVLVSTFPSGEQFYNIVHFLIIHSKVQTASHPRCIQRSTKICFSSGIF